MRRDFLRGHYGVGLVWSLNVRTYLHAGAPFSGARSSGISFNMLHRPDKVRVKQQYICPLENVVVDRSEIVKGYEFRKDEYIVIEPEEIKRSNHRPPRPWRSSSS